ncbi:hypothetical protein D3C78_1180190 [compost metagenome]
MKPVLGKAATSAPKAASFQPWRRRVSATTAPTITRPQARYTPATAGSSSCAMGVAAPKRYSMQGRAKYSTKLFKPAIAGSGSRPSRVAAKPQSTSAKNGEVSSRTDSTVTQR